MATASKDAIAFTVYGFAVSVAQRDAGLAAMQGTFRASHVRHALSKAGVADMPGQQWTVERAADRLMQSERKNRRIVAVRGGNWERVS